MLLFGSAKVHSQVMLSDMECGATDSLQRISIHYFPPDRGGSNRVWDFSKKLSSKESSKLMFMKDSTGTISITEPGMIKYYMTEQDSLVLVGSESPLEKRQFVKKKITLKNPLEFGDSIKKEFRCEGMYCGIHSFREVGSTYLNVDAEGTAVFAGNDSVTNVRRIHTIDTYSVCMDRDSAALDTAKLTQVIDERYGWYFPGAEYPFLELSTSTTYLNMGITGTTRNAYCYLPEDKVSYYTTEEDDNETNQGESLVTNDNTDPDIIHYKINTNDGIISITYDLDEAAAISLIVANHMGFSYIHRNLTQSAGQAYTMQVDCNGLRPGTYILYINVNGKVYSKKIAL